MVCEEYPFWWQTSMQEYVSILLELLCCETVGLFNLGYHCLLELCVTCNNVFLSAGWTNSVLIMLDFVKQLAKELMSKYNCCSISIGVVIGGGDEPTVDPAAVVKREVLQDLEIGLRMRKNAMV